MNHWYSSRDNEIFLDLDSRRAVARALSVLRIAIRQKRLDIRRVWLYGTPTNGHAHMIVELRQSMSQLNRVAWGLWLGNDRLRAAYVLYRWEEYPFAHCDLLVSRTKYGFRKEDAICFCEGKHKEQKVTDACPAMTELLQERRSADYFARTGKAPTRKKIRIPWGKVPLTTIRNWSEPE